MVSPSIGNLINNVEEHYIAHILLASAKLFVDDDLRLNFIHLLNDFFSLILPSSGLKQRRTGKVDTSQTYGNGRYLIGPAYGFLKYPSDRV